MTDLNDDAPYGVPRAYSDLPNTIAKTVKKIKEHPIIFSGDMVRAILAGRKTMTRRIVIPRQSTPRIPPANMYPWLIDGEWQTYDDGRPLWVGEHPDYPRKEGKWFACDYGQPGDQLWVRETWAPYGASMVLYRADEEHYDVRWRPSIHMPRKASRILLEVVSVKIERLQDISSEDIVAEGFPFHPKSLATEVGWDKSDFSALWDSINAKRGFGWDANPWVWVVEFKTLNNTRAA